MLGVLAILLTLSALMYFAYRGVTVLVLAPLLAMLAALLSAEISPLTALSDQFMPAAAGYIENYFPVFLAGAIFGKLMGVSGAATSIAHFIADKFGKKRSIPAIVIATALLTYGGVSLFVVVFAMYPIGVMLLREAEIPKRFLPAAIALGAFTFTMTALPGSPQYINTMPTVFFNTNIYAAPMLGLVGSGVMLSFGLWWLNRRTRVAVAAGEGYGNHENEGLPAPRRAPVAANVGDEGYGKPAREDVPDPRENLPRTWLAFAPILLVFILNFLLTNWIFQISGVIEAVGGSVNGTWSVIIALSVSVVLILLTMRKYIANTNKQVFDGAVGALLPIFNTASEVGYGGVIQGLAAFATVKAGVVALSIPSLFKVAISTSLLAGIVGSSSGGTAIALEVLSQDFLSMDINPEAIHRVMIMAAGGLDTLPHSGAIITLLAVTRLTHRESYGDIAMMTIAGPVLAVLVAIVFHLITGVV